MFQQKLSKIGNHLVVVLHILSFQFFSDGLYLFVMFYHIEWPNNFSGWNLAQLIVNEESKRLTIQIIKIHFMVIEMVMSPFSKSVKWLLKKCICFRVIVNSICQIPRHKHQKFFFGQQYTKIIIFWVEETFIQ